METRPPWCKLLVPVYFKNEKPVNAINNPSGKITQVFGKLERCFHQDGFVSSQFEFLELDKKMV